MNTDELKKLLKSVEICEGSDLGDCDGCPFVDNRFDGCGEEQHKLAKKLLKEMEQEKVEEASVSKSKAIMFGDQTTRNIILEWLHDGGNMLVGYKPTEDYKQWLVGRVVRIDLAKAEIAILGISTGVISKFDLNRHCRIIKWTSGPSAELICINEIGGYKLGKCYYIRNGKLSVDPSEEGRLDTDGRFASLDDEFIKKYFAQWRGCVEFGDPDLNGFFVCTEDSRYFTKGKRYKVANGYFRDDYDNIWDDLVIKHLTLSDLADQMKLYYVPDED